MYKQEETQGLSREEHTSRQIWNLMYKAMDSADIDVEISTLVSAVFPMVHAAPAKRLPKAATTIKRACWNSRTSLCLSHGGGKKGSSMAWSDEAWR